MLIMTFFTGRKLLILRLHGFTDVIKLMIRSSNGKGCILAPSEKQLSTTVTIRSGYIPPFINSLITILSRRKTLGQEEVDVFYCSLGKAVTLRIIRGREFMHNVVGGASFLEISTELRTSIRSDSGWPAKKIEPNLKVTGYSFGCERL